MKLLWLYSMEINYGSKMKAVKTMSKESKDIKKTQERLQERHDKLAADHKAPRSDFKEI